MYYVALRFSGNTTGDTWLNVEIPYFKDKTFNGRHILAGMYNAYGMMVRADTNLFAINTAEAISGTAIDFNGIVVIN